MSLEWQSDGLLWAMLPGIALCYSAWQPLLWCWALLRIIQALSNRNSSTQVTSMFVSSSVIISAIIVNMVSVSYHCVFNAIEKTLGGQRDTKEPRSATGLGRYKFWRQLHSVYSLYPSKKSLLQKCKNGFALKWHVLCLEKKDAVRNVWVVNMNKTDLSSPNLTI